jgi:hypothetical protein
MKWFASQRFLAIYAGVLTLVFAITVVCGFAAPRNKTFDQITVHRINLVEPDGTPRLIISDRTEFPGAYIRGKEYPRPDRNDAAGMLFMNDEATENGGMLWGGRKNSDGKIESFGHLSFDQYDQDQIFTIDSGREGEDKFSGIQIDDRGDYPIQEGIEEGSRITALPQDQQEVERKKFLAMHTGDANRIYLGRSPDKSASLRMKDEQGRDRLVLRVNADGNPVIQFLDADGKVTHEFTGSK